MKIYVLVIVTYNIYRFQENLGAFITIDDAKEFAREIDEKDIFCYPENYNDELDEKEHSHWCIQEYEV